MGHVLMSNYLDENPEAYCILPSLLFWSILDLLSFVK